MSDGRVRTHQVRPLGFVPNGLYGTIVTTVMDAMGGDSQKAERVVDKAFALLGLLPPLPEVPDGVTCDRVYFSDEGRWLFCVEPHPDPDDEEDTRMHFDIDAEDWQDDPGDPRAMRRKGRSHTPYYATTTDN